MSASRPGSVMLRAATAASGGTGAPDWTYCSICAWTLRTSAWTSTPCGLSSASISTRAMMDGSTPSKPSSRSRCWPWTMARTVPSWSCDDLGDLGQRADLVQLGRVGDVLAVRLALGHERDGRAVRDGLVEGVDRLVAADLEGHDHLREDDRLAQRDERQGPRTDPGRPRARSLASAVVGGLALVVRLAIVVSSECLVRDGPASAGRAAGPSDRGPTGPVDRDVRFDVGRPVHAVSFAVELFQDAHAEPLLELEQDADAGEVHAQVLGQVADPEDPPDVVLGVADGCWCGCGPGTADPRPRRCGGCGDGPAPAPRRR